MLAEGAEDGSEEPLSDDFEIEAACTVALCATPEEEWDWDAASDLIKDEVFELSGPNNSIATKIDQDEDWKNCMVVGRVMGAGTGKHTISMKIAHGNHFASPYCGVVRDGTPCNENHYTRESTVGWFMAGDRTLCGNGKWNEDGAGRIRSGQVLTMQVDTDAGTLKFWVDGKPHGPGGVTGPLRCAATLYTQALLSRSCLRWSCSRGHHGNRQRKTISQIIPTADPVEPSRANTGIVHIADSSFIVIVIVIAKMLF